MNKYVEGTLLFTGKSLIIWASINFLFHAHVISYVESMVLFVLSNLLFKNAPAVTPKGE